MTRPVQVALAALIGLAALAANGIPVDGRRFVAAPTELVRAHRRDRWRRALSVQRNAVPSALTLMTVLTAAGIVTAGYVMRRVGSPGSSTRLQPDISSSRMRRTTASVRTVSGIGVGLVARCRGVSSASSA